MDNFEKALRFVLEWEVGKDSQGNLRTDGGLVIDTGGLTKWGISSRAFPKLNVSSLTLEQAASLYRDNYWTRIHGDNLSLAVGIVLFDSAVNCGVDRALRWQGVVENIAGILEKNKARKIIELREAYYYDLKTADPVKYGKYYKGWINRTTDLRKYIDINAP